jgi:hypothetical protein
MSMTLHGPSFIENPSKTNTFKSLKTGEFGAMKPGMNFSHKIIG